MVIRIDFGTRIHEIAGLLLDVAGRIPVAGDTIELDGFTAEVVRMDRNRVDRIKLRKK